MFFPKRSGWPPIFFYLFGKSRSLPFCVASLKKICAWELLGANVLKSHKPMHKDQEYTCMLPMGTSAIDRVTGISLKINHDHDNNHYIGISYSNFNLSSTYSTFRFFLCMLWFNKTKDFWCYLKIIQMTHFFRGEDGLTLN